MYTCLIHPVIPPVVTGERCPGVNGIPPSHSGSPRSRKLNGVDVIVYCDSKPPYHECDYVFRLDNTSVICVLTVCIKEIKSHFALITKNIQHYKNILCKQHYS